MQNNPYECPQTCSFPMRGTRLVYKKKSIQYPWLLLEVEFFFQETKENNIFLHPSLFFCKLKKKMVASM